MRGRREGRFDRGTCQSNLNLSPAGNVFCFQFLPPSEAFDLVRPPGYQRVLLEKNEEHVELKVRPKGRQRRDKIRSSVEAEELIFLSACGVSHLL